MKYHLASIAFCPIQLLSLPINTIIVFSPRMSNASKVHYILLELSETIYKINALGTEQVPANPYNFDILARSHSNSDAL